MLFCYYLFGGYMDEKSSDDIELIITQKDEKTFIVEAKSQYLKWAISDIKKVEFQYGPKFAVGKEFYNKGIIEDIEKIESNNFFTKSIKVTLK